jgi:hypothetical protein
LHQRRPGRAEAGRDGERIGDPLQAIGGVV